MSDANSSMIKMLAGGGHRGKIVSIERLDELREEIEIQHDQGRLDKDLYREYLSSFTFRPPERFPEARSIIVVSSGDPLVRFHFIWKGKKVAGMVPPTYLHGQKVDKELESALMGHIQVQGHRVAPAVLPKKLLAVRSGLARYGRNNITYIGGMGSFHRLTAFFSSLPCRHDDWSAPKMLERCETCSACRMACPTGAIGEDRFLLRAERCIVFHNEKPGDVPFPEWIHPSWHNCLVGCMICQQACPENRDVLGRIREGAAFSESETGLLLKGVPLDQLPSETAEKLRSSDLAGLLNVLPRNLQALLNAEDSGSLSRHLE